MIDVDKGGYVASRPRERVWRAQSLRGPLAMQAVQDFRSEWRRVECGCGKTFTMTNRTVKQGLGHGSVYRQQQYRDRVRTEGKSRSRKLSRQKRAIRKNVGSRE